jgi:lysozyme
MSMSISARGIALIKQFEGFSPKAYLCPAGKLTIGYGHVVQERDAIARDARLSEGEAEKLLLHDLRSCMRTINRLVAVPLSQNQFDALCSLVYNIGEGAFSRSKLLRLINTGDTRAGAEFLRWIYAAGKPLSGLKNRRMIEKELFDK